LTTIRIVLQSKLNPDTIEAIKERAINYLDKDDYPIALDLYGLELLVNNKHLLEEKKASPDWWPPLLIHAAIDDILNYFSESLETERGIDYYWDQLSSSPYPDEIRKLYLSGISEGLNLTPKAVQTIEQIITTDKIDLLYPILPLLQSPDITTIINVEKWILYKNERLSNYASLYHGEYFNRVSEENIDGILNLRLSKDMRTFCRTNILLSNGMTKVRRERPRKYKISDFSLVFLRKVAQKLKHEKTVLQNTSSLSHFFADIEIDDEIILKTILNDPFFSPIFVYASELNEKLMNPTIQYISDQEKSKIIFNNLINLVIQNLCEFIENKIPIYGKLQSVLYDKYQTEVSKIKFVPNSIFSLVYAYDSTEEKNIEQVDRKLDELCIGINEIISLPYEYNKEVIESGLLRAYGYHYSNNYLFKNITSLQEFKSLYNDQIFEFFVHWFLHLNQYKIYDSNQITFDVREELIMISLGIWAEERNTSIINALNVNDDLYTALIKDRTWNNGSTALAIINLWKQFQHHTLEGIEFMMTKLKKENFIQVAAIEALKSIKIVTDELVDYLFTQVREKDALIGSICVSILANYAKNSSTKSHVRRNIITEMSNLLNDPETKRGIYHFNAASGNIEDRVKLQYAGRLDELVANELISIMDI
jgi:hypothetical protein